MNENLKKAGLTTFQPKDLTTVEWALGDTPRTDESPASKLYVDDEIKELDDKFEDTLVKMATDAFDVNVDN